MRVLVCGSRDWGDERRIFDALGYLTVLHGRGDPVTVVHGAASRVVRGREVSADMLADRIAHRYGFDVERHPADWVRHGRRAGFLRNVAMLETGIDAVLAFQRNGSRGTQHTIDEARKRGIRVEVFTA